MERRTKWQGLDWTWNNGGVLDSIVDIYIHTYVCLYFFLLLYIWIIQHIHWVKLTDRSAWILGKKVWKWNDCKHDLIVMDLAVCLSVLQSVCMFVCHTAMKILTIHGNIPFLININKWKWYFKIIRPLPHCSATVVNVKWLSKVSTHLMNVIVSHWSSFWHSWKKHH